METAATLWLEHVFQGAGDPSSNPLLEFGACPAMLAKNAEPTPSGFSEATKPDLLTIVAITVVATVMANFIHEGIGHGGMCIVTGGRALVLSTVHLDCSADTRLVAAGGTLANLIFGALFWAAERVKRSAHWRYFFWLLMTFNLLSAGGYFLFSGIGNIGDWAAVVAGWEPAWAWRMGMAALGVFSYFFVFVPLSVRELVPFLGPAGFGPPISRNDPKIRVRRARRQGRRPGEEPAFRPRDVTNQTAQTASQPTLAKNARMGHPLWEWCAQISRGATRPRFFGGKICGDLLLGGAALQRCDKRPFNKHPCHSEQG